MKTFTLSLATLMLAGCAASQAQESQQAERGPQFGRDCFNVRMVSGYSSVDRDTIRLDAGPRRSYEVDISGPMCDQVDWTQRIALESNPGSWICVGDAVGQGEIHFRDPATRQRVSCYIDAVRRVAEEDRAPRAE